MTVSEGPGMTSEQLSADEAAERNLTAVDAHFHSEIQQDIDSAIDLYGDNIVWEAPARGVLLRGKAAVRQPISTFSSRCTFIPSPPCVGSWPEIGWWTIASGR